MYDSLSLLLGTIVLRPYVFVFLAVYLVASSSHVGWRRTLVYLPVGYGLAWFSEFSSIHWGFPYGDYYYISSTVGKELWVLGVPFMDSLSYVFLSYCSYSLAVFLLSPVLYLDRTLFVLETHEIRRSWQTLILGSLLFVLLDIIIDPVALQGHRWFLGQIYGYRNEGLYFGIPMSNFGGWLLVGLVLIGSLQVLDSFSNLEPQRKGSQGVIPGIRLLGPLLYVSILLFNLAITFWIGERLLCLVGSLILTFPAALALFLTLYKRTHVTQEQIERHAAQFALAGTSHTLPSASHPRRPELSTSN